MCIALAIQVVVVPVGVVVGREAVTIIIMRIIISTAVWSAAIRITVTIPTRTAITRRSPHSPIVIQTVLALRVNPRRASACVPIVARSR